MSMKNPMTPAGIEPATFRFLTQHLKHCATSVPQGLVDGIEIDFNSLKTAVSLCHTGFDIMQLRSANSAYVCFECRPSSDYFSYIYKILLLDSVPLDHAILRIS